MKVFISWSGETSKLIAKTLKDWIPAVIQAVKPYFTEDDIVKGTRWNNEIAKELESCSIGLICLTRDNLDAPWIMFETGALAKNLDKSRVCPLLFNVDPYDIKGPLVQFQAARFERTELKRVMEMINAELGESALSKSVFDEVFEMWWPRLETDIKNLLQRSHDPVRKIIRTEKDLLVEILELVRLQTRDSMRSQSTQFVAMTKQLFFRDYYDEEVIQFASKKKSLGKRNDQNSEDWADRDLMDKLHSLDGLWFSRWNGGAAGLLWKSGNAVIKTIGEKVYILVDDSGYPYIIVSSFTGENILTGRYYRIEGSLDSTPWAGKIVNDERIDGAWLEGRWDFRRNLTKQRS